MSEPFLSEIKLVSFNFPPKGWALANGQLLPINQNQALFSLLGTTYGGDGRVNFALPDLRGRAAIHEGVCRTLGERGGQDAHTITQNELPAHLHFVNASSSEGNAAQPSSTTVLASPLNQSYDEPSAQSKVAMDAGSVTSVGGSQAHLNMQPYLVLSFCIALQGIFPSQT